MNDRDGRAAPATEYFPLAGPRWEQLRKLWLALPAHPALLDPIGVTADGLALRYAAVMWQPDLSVKVLATIGAQLADLYRTCLVAVPESELGHLALPFWMIDLVGYVRIGFKRVDGWNDKMAPEMKKTWPRCDQQALVYAIGELVSDSYTRLDKVLPAVINRCHEHKPKKRYATLEDVRDAFKGAAQLDELVRTDDLLAWRHLEEGIGWLELGDTTRALDHFTIALGYEPYAHIAQWGHDVARELIRAAALAKPRQISGRIIKYGPSRRISGESNDDFIGPAVSVPWATAEPEGLRLEVTRDFAGALLLYNSVDSDPENHGAVLGSCARVHFALGNTGSAIDCARRGLAADASRLETRVVLAKALLARGDHAEALAQAEQLVSLSGGDATSHYLCGKALFALGRLDEARRAFDVACSLQPTLLEAMLLRREVDRCIGDGGKRVGSQGPIAVEIPASLTELRDVLIGGRTNDAIAALSEPRFADDPDAQLVLARMFAFDGQLERAATIYDRVAVMPDPHRWSALVGKAALLVDLGNLESALALFDLLRAERPSDLDVAEWRARALAELGRTDEAAAEYRHFVALATSRSDLRVRAAQLWLEQH